MNVLYVHALTSVCVCVCVCLCECACLCVCVCVCVCAVSISLQASTVRPGLCYRCNKPGICSLLALSPQSTGRSSCRGSCPPPPRPLATSAPSVQPRSPRDWPASPGATCQSGRAGSLPLYAATAEREEEESKLRPNRI